MGKGLPPGTTVEGSSTAGSDDARALDDVIRATLSQAFGATVNAKCFMEFRQADNSGIWIAYSIPATQPADLSTKLEGALKAKGATATGTFGGASGG